MANLTAPEQASLQQYRSISYNSLPKEHQVYYDYLLQKSRVPEAIEKGSTHSTKKVKKPKPKQKGNPIATFYIIGFILILIAAMILYAEYYKPVQKEIKMPDALVMYRRN